MDAIPAAPGTYILLLRLGTAATLAVGRRGTFGFPAGAYAYVGSAFGPGGLRGRLKHHLSPVARPHWHIDYLRAVAPVRAVYYHASATRHEHTWAAALLAAPGTTVPAPRFGASNCTCPAHLVRLAAPPDAAWLAAVVGAPLAVYTRR